MIRDRCIAWMWLSFFFSSRRRHTRFDCDWSSDVCSSDLRPVKTFTIGFLEAGHNEAIHARKVAAHLGTNHTELYIGPDEALAVIPKLPSLFDEPFADSSQIPTYLVSALARTQVTVSLSGDGGDELFGGYNEYLVARKLWKAVGWTPQRGRSLLSRSVTAVRPESYSRLLKGLELPFSRYGRVGPVGDKLHKLAELLSFQTLEDLHRCLMF